MAEGRRERQQTKTGSAAGLTGLNWLRRERGKPKPVYSSKKYLRYRHSIHAPPPSPAPHLTATAAATGDAAVAAAVKLG